MRNDVFYMREFIQRLSTVVIQFVSNTFSLSNIYGPATKKKKEAKWEAGPMVGALERLKVRRLCNDRTTLQQHRERNKNWRGRKRKMRQKRGKKRKKDKEEMSKLTRKTRGKLSRAASSWISLGRWKKTT